MRYGNYRDDLFLNHKNFIHMRRTNDLEISEAAIEVLGQDLELTEVDSGLAKHSVSAAQQREKETKCENEQPRD